jgi:hypothetical protein
MCVFLAIVRVVVMAMFVVVIVVVTVVCGGFVAVRLLDEHVDGRGGDPVLRRLADPVLDGEGGLDG